MEHIRSKWKYVNLLRSQAGLGEIQPPAQYFQEVGELETYLEFAEASLEAGKKQEARARELMKVSRELVARVKLEMDWNRHQKQKAEMDKLIEEAARKLASK
jgi:hypothetical protein